jgi:DNA-binding NarL/FixJ family response regulator
MKPPRKWNEEEDRCLLELRTAGKTLIQIAKELNRTESSVAARIVVLKRQGKAAAEAEFSDGSV